ncbi:unnamed protein product [Peniophora sp. CBMAI 1063]|nr:unnamed protein product [Peniophora sp. CBMAI 1063]
MRAHSRILDSLPEFVWLGHSVHRRFEESARVSVLVNAAISAAIQVFDLARAVEWLESGRSLIWSQVASQRSSLDALVVDSPELAHAVRKVHAELQQLHAGNRVNVPPPSLDLDSLAGESEAEQYRRAAIRYDKLVKEIRQREGFEDFLRPKTFDGIISSPMFARLKATTIFVTVARSSCDALVLLECGDLKLVKLPELSLKRVERLRGIWTGGVGLYRAHRGRMASWEVALLRRCSSIHALVLGRLWKWIVHPILDALGLIQDAVREDPLPHIIWCPTGPLTQLPLHAAGIYDQESGGPRIYDFAVSSYTPSLCAALRCVRDNAEWHSAPSMLFVAQSKTLRTDHPPLPHVRDESARVRALMPGPNHTFLEDEQATLASTLAAVDKHPWVHFACHGSQNAQDPTLSSIELYDKPLTLTDLMRTVSDNAELAFLSACETAVGDQKIPEESAHLAAGMLAVGFKGVVATMWSIRDEDGPVIVDAYYKELLRLRASGTVREGHTGAPYALHHAVGCLREAVGETNFERWVPFVHFGV